MLKSMWIWGDVVSAGIEPGTLRITNFLECRALHQSWTIAFFKCHFHPLPFSVSPASVQISPTCRFHLLWYAIRYAPIPRSRTVSWVLCGWAGAHHPLNLAIERNFTQKKERKKHLLTDFMYFHLSYVMISVVGFCLHVKFTHGFLSPKKSIFTFLWENVK